MMSRLQYVRTQVYLEPDQHWRLKSEAHRRGISLASLLRQLVDDASGTAPSRSDLSRIIGLGKSAGGDVAGHKQP